ncbi:MAG: DUF2804 family protein [Leptospiraceae bacterium]|nr:DUF2804 family protein [Leptospiraceae bacterium]
MKLPNKLDESVDISDYFGRYIGDPIQIDTQRWDKLNFYQNRFLQRKGWVFVSYMTEDFICSVAIVDVGYLGNGFVYLYDRESNQLYEEKVTMPLAFDINFHPSLKTDWKLTGISQAWKLLPQNDSYCFSYSGRKIIGEINFKINKPGLNVITHSIGRPFHYTYKNMGLSASVSIQVNKKQYQEVGNNAVIDFSFGYPPRTTTWNWASLMGNAEDGTPIRINLVAEFNNGLENALWFGDNILFLSQSIFKYSGSIRGSNIKIETTDGILQIQFFPEGFREETIDVGFLKSEFVQPFGRFEGIYANNGKPVKIKGIGLLEEHVAIW